MLPFQVCLILLTLTATAWARPNLFNLDFGSFFSFPQVRRGRATAATALALNDDSEGSKSSVSVSKNSDEDTDVIAKLIDAVMQEVVGEPRAAET